MKVLAAVATAMVVSVGAAPPALAIDEGVPDRDRHPNVGLLGYDVDGRPGPTPASSSGCRAVRPPVPHRGPLHPGFPRTEWVVTLEPGSPPPRSPCRGCSPTTSRSR